MSLDLDLNYFENNFKVDKLSNNRVYQFEEFTLDAAHLMLSRSGEEIPLVPKAVETLRVLVERRGEILSKTELMDAIWTDSVVEESNLAQYLHILRKTLGKQQNGKPFIETLRRRGYRFNGDVAITNATNGFSQRRRATDVEENLNTFAGNFAGNNDGFLKTLVKPAVRVERHGNVLALADWKEAEKHFVPEVAAVAQPDANYSGSGSKPKLRRVYLAAFVFAALLFGSLSIIWFRSGSSTPKRGELTFSNLTSGEDVNEATISPDGNYFVYSSHDGEKAHLWLQQTGQASRLEIVEPFAGHIYGASFTPDSKSVYFVVDENQAEPWALYRVAMLGGAKTKILTNVGTPVSFSPDGNEMVFMRGDAKTGQSSIVIATSDGKQERIFLTRTRDNAESLNGGGAWSPDGRSIAYGLVDLKTPWNGACTIVATDVQTGETKPLSTETWDTCYRMAWTRDGQGLVFVGTKSNEAFSTRRDQVYYLSIADGKSRRITTDGNRHLYASLGVTDSDEILAVPFNRMSQIWAMDASGDARTVVQITKGFADGRGGIAPLSDGRVAYLTRNGDGFSIWLMNPDGTDRKQLTTDPPAIEELRAAPDGSFFVFSAKHDSWAHLFRVDSDGANLRQLTFGESGEVDSTVSPDGNWIVYHSNGSKGNYGKFALWKISSDGGEPIPLGDADCLTPHFSPDGKFVSCVSPDWKKITIISAENGVTLKTFETVANPILNVGARWTVDGKGLVYIANQKNVGNLQLQPTGGEAIRPLTDFTSGDIYNFAFSIDGTRIFLARGYQTRNAILISNFR